MIGKAKIKKHIFPQREDVSNALVAITIMFIVCVAVACSFLFHKNTLLLVFTIPIFIKIVDKIFVDKLLVRRHVKWGEALSNSERNHTAIRAIDIEWLEHNSENYLIHYFNTRGLFVEFFDPNEKIIFLVARS